jgi:putative oxidoreductase
MDLALLVLRAVVGLLFAGHGAQKLFGWFGGGGPEGTAAMFDGIGLRPGHTHARIAGIAEFGGGLALAFGLLTPFAAAALIGVMTAAILSVHGANGIWITDKGFEYNLVLITAAFTITAAGPGSASLDSAFGIGLSGVGWALLALAAGIAGGASTVASGRAYQEEHEERQRGAPPHPA